MFIRVVNWINQRELTESTDFSVCEKTESFV